MPTAGTAQTSERSKRDFTGRCVPISTLPRGSLSVEIGFIAAFRTIVWPVEMPPSMPPARLLARHVATLGHRA